MYFLISNQFEALPGDKTFKIVVNEAEMEARLPYISYMIIPMRRLKNNRTRKRKKYIIFLSFKTENAQLSKLLREFSFVIFLKQN